MALISFCSTSRSPAPKSREYLIGGRCNLLICRRTAGCCSGRRESTWITACPLLLSTSRSISGIPRRVASIFRSSPPSAPTQPACHTCAPARASADWLSPLPPQNVSSFEGGEASRRPYCVGDAVYQVPVERAEIQYSSCPCPFVTIMYAV